MKEDILEQLVDDYLQAKGYFTMHNVKFRPLPTDEGFVANDDRVASDIDVVGLNPMLEGTSRVWVVSCKSWQMGFKPNEWISYFERGIVQDEEKTLGKRIAGRPAWKYFRELVKKKWADALVAKIEKLTGSRNFTYVTAVTKLTGPEEKWIVHEMFKQNLAGNPIRFLTLEQMLQDLYKNTSTTVAASDVGRLLQVIKACGWRPA